MWAERLGIAIGTSLLRDTGAARRCRAEQRPAPRAPLECRAGGGRRRKRPVHVERGARQLHQGQDLKRFQRHALHAQLVQQGAGLNQPGQSGPRALAQILARLPRQFQVAPHAAEVGVRSHPRQPRLADGPG